VLGTWAGDVIIIAGVLVSRGAIAGKQSRSCIAIYNALFNSSHCGNSSFFLSLRVAVVFSGRSTPMGRAGTSHSGILRFSSTGKVVDMYIACHVETHRDKPLREYPAHFLF